MDKQNSLAHLNRMLFLRTIIIGIFGGVFWGIFFLIMYGLKIMEIAPTMLLKIVFQDEKWIEKWYAYLIFILMISILSIFIALIYFFVFKQWKSWIVGAFYGIGLWVFTYFILPIILKNVNPFIHLESESHISMFCLFILYGVFVGYSISFDYENLKEEYKVE